MSPSRLKKKEKSMSKQVFSIQWHLTERCDQRCKHCYIYNSQSIVNTELPIETLEIILHD